MGRVHGDSSSNFIVGSVTMFCLLVASFTFAFAYGAPAAEADAEADPQFLGGADDGVPVGPAPNCVTEEEIFVTQVCTPGTEDVCSKETVLTEEIEYEKVCKDVVDTLCDAPVAHAAPAVAAAYHSGYGKRSADAEPEADPQYAYGYGPAHAYAHSVTATVKHACREVITQHCDTITKVACEPVENKIPKTTCEPVETQHVGYSGYYGHGGYVGRK